MHDFQEQCQTVFHVMLCLSIFPSKQFTIKQLLNSCFVIARIINPWLDLGVGQGNHFVSVTVNNNNSPIQDCLRADVSYFLCPFSACNKGNRRRLQAGKFRTTFTWTIKLNLSLKCWKKKFFWVKYIMQLNLSSVTSCLDR